MGKPAQLKIDVLQGDTSGIEGLHKTDQAAKDAAQGLETLASSAQTADTKMKGIGEDVARNIDEVGGNAARTAGGIGDLAGAFELMNMPGVADKMGIVGTAMMAAAGASDLWTVATKALNLETLRGLPTKVADTAKTLASAAAERAAAAATAISSGAKKAAAAVTAIWNTVTSAFTLANLRATASVIAQTVATIAANVAQKTVQAATLAWTAAQWLLNTAMLANPIGLIIVGIIALIAVIVLAWNHSETFRKIVTAAWDGIKNAAISAWNWIKDVIWPGLKFVLNLIGEYYKTLWGVVQTAWDAITRIISGAWDTLKGIFDKVIEKVKKVIDWFRDLTDFKFPSWLNPFDWFKGVPSSMLMVSARGVPMAGVTATAATQTLSQGFFGLPEIRIYLDGREISGTIERVATRVIDAQGRRLMSRGWA